jgi:hypothetical protein
MDRVVLLSQAQRAHTRIMSAALLASTHGSREEARRTRRILLASSRRMARRAFQAYWREA